MNILTIHCSLGPFYLVMFFLFYIFRLQCFVAETVEKQTFFIRFELMTLLMMGFCLFATVTVKPNDKQLLRICRMIYLCALVRAFLLAILFRVHLDKTNDRIEARRNI